MKNISAKLLLFLFILFGASLSASAQIYVNVRPVSPVIIRSEAPSPTHIWIGEDWHADGNNYRYSGGYWSSPPHPGYTWRAGHWNHHKKHGDRWVRGGWTSRRNNRR